ncbi:MAG: nucleoside kinase, partial [Spirochaetales bacterium]|nr:nucleoside kinase [Spirochaetales bacterium]
MAVFPILDDMNNDQEHQIRLTLPNGEISEVPYGTRILKIIQDEQFQSDREFIVGGLVNNEVVSLTFKVEVNAAFKPITVTSPEGARIYRQSLCFLLTIAANELFPAKRLVIGHSLGDAYFFYFDGEDDILDIEIVQLEDRMRELVNDNLEFERRVLSYGDALEYLRETGHHAAEQLLEHRCDSKIAVYECGGYRDITHGPLVKCTSVLKTFALLRHPPGFLLR